MEAVYDLARHRKSLDRPDEEDVDTINWNHTSVFNKPGNFTTVKLQWLEHLWDHGNLFELWLV